MCLYPRLMRNMKYYPNKKNGGQVPPVSDNRVMVVPIGCGECMECRKQKARDWQIRLLEDIRHNKNGKFVCLTFSNEEITKLYNEKEIVHKIGYEKDNAAATLAVRRFTERWRKIKGGKTIRHWLVTELGHNGTENIHMHGIVWTDETEEKIKEKWAYGRVWFGKYVNEKTINYTIKYVHKIDKDHKYYKSKVFTSNGIGKGYFKRIDSEGNKYKEGKTKEYYTTRSGHKTALPKYYRNNIYSEEEKEKLWIEKIEQNIRYVDGKPIDISKGEEIYKKELKQAQQKSKRIGYGDGAIEWDLKEYEESRRTVMQRMRGRE